MLEYMALFSKVEDLVALKDHAYFTKFLSNSYDEVGCSTAKGFGLKDNIGIESFAALLQEEVIKSVVEGGAARIKALLEIDPSQSTDNPLEKCVISWPQLNKEHDKSASDEGVEGKHDARPHPIHSVVFFTLSTVGYTHTHAHIRTRRPVCYLKAYV